MDGVTEQVSMDIVLFILTNIFHAYWCFFFLALSFCILPSDPSKPTVS